MASAHETSRSGGAPSRQTAPAGVRAQGAPDFFIVGHPKCGTTALWETLRAHPQIYMPAVKEPRFFATDLQPARDPRVPARGPRSHSAPSATGGSALTREQYLALFDAAAPSQRAGEASPLYLMSEVAARAIAEVAPDARIIAILREPASFLRSLHLQWVRSHFETQKDLRKAIALERARREGRRIPRSSRWRPRVLLYSEHVRYVEQLRRYHAVFAPEQVLVLIYEDFRRDNEATLCTVLRFLEVEGTIPPEAAEVNPTVRLRSRRLEQTMHAVSVGGNPVSLVAKATVKTLLPRGLRRRALAGTRRHLLYGAPPAPDEALMAELRSRFEGEVVALSEYLGRDLVTQWGYDRVR